MIVYVEWVIFDNFCLDFLLGYFTLRLTKREVRYFPLILSAIAGSVFALFSPLVRQATWLYKIGVLLACSALIYLKKSLRGYLVNTFVYAVQSFLLSGILTFLLGGKAAYTFIGVQAGGVVGAISIGTFLFADITRQLVGLGRERALCRKTAVAELFSGEKSVKLNALMDSGNLLTDRNGEGVVVSDARAVVPLGELTSCGEMRVKTASGSKILKLVKIPRIKIYFNGGENTLIDVTVALSDLPKEYPVILPY